MRLESLEGFQGRQPPHSKRLAFDLTSFDDETFRAIGAWQRGWREDQLLRAQLGDQLRAATEALPLRFRAAVGPCYRKRFLRLGELEALFVRDELDEGLASWTTDQECAKAFKGLHRPDAVSGAIFRHQPSPAEVILDIAALWRDTGFRAAADSYRRRAGENADALFHFKETQSEVVLQSPLRASEIIALTGASSPFEALCDGVGVPSSDRDGIFRELVANDVVPEDAQYLSEEASQRVVSRTLAVFLEARLRRDQVGSNLAG